MTLVLSWFMKVKVSGYNQWLLTKLSSSTVVSQEVKILVLTMSSTVIEHMHVWTRLLYVTLLTIVVMKVMRI